MSDPLHSSCPFACPNQSRYTLTSVPTKAFSVRRHSDMWDLVAEPATVRTDAGSGVCSERNAD